MRRLAIAAAAVTTLLVAGVALAPSASAATAAFVRTSSWGTGYEARFTVTNNTSTTITSLDVAVRPPGGHQRRVRFWDANMTRSGQRFTFTNKSWNGTLGPNGDGLVRLHRRGQRRPDQLHGQRHLLQPAAVAPAPAHRARRATSG